MLKRLFISNLLLLLLVSTHVFSEEKTRRIKGPITITSETLIADNKEHTARFEHSVIARTTDMTLYADRMLVSYDTDSGAVKMIEAEGNIKLLKGTRAIISETATYYADEEMVTFAGEPRATDGENVVTGSKITYLLNDDRYIVENSKVFIRKQKVQ
jgi:lipopolysaccharide export system protein LptA